jgi:hypothetical protein
MCRKRCVTVAAVCLVTSGPAQKVSRVPLFLRAVQAPHSAAPVYCDTMLSLATAWDTLADLHCPAVAVADTLQRRMEAHAARHERIERARSQMRDVLGVCPLPRERERERTWWTHTGGGNALAFKPNPMRSTRWCHDNLNNIPYYAIQCYSRLGVMTRLHLD